MEKENVIAKSGVGVIPKEKRIFTKLEILKKLSPGTPLREGINDILRAEMGALIVVSNENSANVCEGGFKVNCKFTPRRLGELAKMDGAIVLSSDGQTDFFQ